MTSSRAQKGQRSCVACGTRADKAKLHRIVRTAEGNVALDETGKAAGRGAYVCSPACLDALRGSERLDRALRIKLSEGDYERIVDQLGCLCAGEIGKIEG